MKRRDIIILIVCTIVIIGVLVLVLGGHKSSTTTGPQPPKVTPVNPKFDNATISKVQQNFPVNLDLTGLGRPDPFSGI